MALRYFVIVFVVGLEVGGCHLDVVRHLVGQTKAEAIGVDDERHIVHVIVGELIAGDLSTGRDIQFLGDVPFSTGKILVGATVEFLLGMLIPMGICVVVVVVAQVDADFGNDAPLCTQRAAPERLHRHPCCRGTC